MNETNPTILPESIGSIIRNAMAAFGGSMVALGQLDEADAATAGGAVSMLASLAWSIWQKRRARLALEAAKNAAPGASA